jgi:hypothetical protein
MQRKFIAAAIVTSTVFTAPALAQLPGSDSSSQTSLGIPLKSDAPPTQEEIEKRKANDRAYQAAIQKIPDKKASTDPWGTIRPTAPTSKNKQQQ